MAISTKAVEGQAKAPAARKTGKEPAPSERLYAQGNQILSTMSEEQRSQLGSKSHTLHFQRLLGLQSKKSSRRVAKDETRDCSTAVGIELISDEDIEVPVIDITKDKYTGITAEDISYRKVKAGEVFNLSYYEFMFLILRDEYAGSFEANGNPKGAFFSAKMHAFFDSRTKLPTPVINLRDGAIKATMVDIDEKGPDGVWVIKEPYREKYGALLKKAKPRRAAAGKKSAPKTTVVSVALKQILEQNAGIKI